MSCIVILSMHRSGSSLTASIIQSLGVHIGDNLLGASPSNPSGHFENMDFYRLNMDILRAAGGNWQNIPSYGNIMATRNQFAGRICRTVAQNKRALWGWKEPRTTILLPLYLPHLEDPKFVLVYRKTRGIVKSLQKRSGSKEVEKWERLTKIYQDSMEKWSTGYPTIKVDYEALINRFLARVEVNRLNTFVGGNCNIERALGNIHFEV